MAIILGTLLGWGVPASVLAQSQPAPGERIVNFRSLIQVQPDASILVTENITVRAERQQIRHGIVREFPTTYTDRQGRTVRVGFEVLQVLKNGQTEPYRVERVQNGVKIFIGKKEVVLTPGVYSFIIQYRTHRQLGFFPEYDELYWNVTGNGWTFAIDTAEAVVELPERAKILQYAAYTGYQGEKGKSFFAKPLDRNIYFRTTRLLAPQEGLTVAVAWPKGVVRQPTWVEDHKETSAALFGLALLTLFYLAAWVQVGRDPAKGTVIPIFTPPANLSPAAVRYIFRMGFDHKTFAAAVVDTAVKGGALIEEDADGVYTIKAKKPQEPLPPDEERLAAQMFSQGGMITLQNENHAMIKAALKTLERYLKLQYEKHYFFTNSVYLAPGILIALLSLGAVVWFAPDRYMAGFGALWLSIWTVFCYALVVGVWRKWQALGGRLGFTRLMKALVATLFALAFLGGEVMGIFMFANAVSLTAAISLAVMLLLTAAFYHLLKAPTLLGRRTMDQIEGFKMYLSVAEKERLEMLHPPEKTPELFEKCLPYAMALDVETEWTQQFNEVLAQAGEGGQSYQPTWYYGPSHGYLDMSDFSSSLGSAFTGAISSSSVAPGSDSGSGGGGFSGGGGGGGGGSGW
jgi:uncharacterized membrane protein YgcG